MLLILAVLAGTMTFTVDAVEFSEEEAFGYLDSYADNVGTDEAFDENNITIPFNQLVIHNG